MCVKVSLWSWVSGGRTPWCASTMRVPSVALPCVHLNDLGGCSMGSYGILYVYLSS